MSRALTADPVAREENTWVGHPVLGRAARARAPIRHKCKPSNQNRHPKLIPGVEDHKVVHRTVGELLDRSVGRGMGRPA